MKMKKIIIKTKSEFLDRQSFPAVKLNSYYQIEYRVKSQIKFFRDYYAINAIQ